MKQKRFREMVDRKINADESRIQNEKEGEKPSATANWADDKCAAELNATSGNINSIGSHKTDWPS